MLSGWRLAVALYVLVAEAGRNAWLRCVALIQVEERRMGSGRRGRGRMYCITWRCTVF